MLDEAELERRVKEMASATYGDDVILEVHCMRDVDHESDPVVWVRFVVKERGLRSDPVVSLRFETKLRLAFDDWGEVAYPLTAFYTENEYRKLFPAAA